MKFKATPALLYLLHTQIAEFPGEAKVRPWPGCTVYSKLDTLDGNKGGTVEIDEAERKELLSLLDSIVGPCGWDTLELHERRTGKAAVKRLGAVL